MVGSINPVVSGDVRRSRFLLSVLAYTVASALAASGFGALLALAAAPLRERLSAGVSAAAIGLLALAYAAHELVGTPMPEPQRRRQVPSGWRVTFPNWVAAGLYGAYLGPGFLTYVFSGSYYVVLFLCAVALRAPEAAVVMAAFGAAKGVSILIRGLPVHSLEDSFRRGIAICDSGRRAHVVNGVTLSLAGLACLAAALG